MIRYDSIARRLYVADRHIHHAWWGFVIVGVGVVVVVTDWPDWRDWVPALLTPVPAIP